VRLAESPHEGQSLDLRYGRVEKPADHRKLLIDALHERNLGGAGEHRESRIREGGDIARDSAEQPDEYPKAHKARASLVSPHSAACAVKSFL
jgi:hypothetical protein